MYPLKVGVIGLGRMGQQHCRVYAGLRRAQLMGVSDIDPTTGTAIAQRYDVPFYANVDDLLDRVDAISLVTPTPAHFDLAMHCLERGIHVLIEKPITETVSQAETLVKVAEASNLIVQIGHIERFNPAYIEMKNVFEDFEVLAINIRRLSAYSGSNKDVNVVLDLMIHDTDLILDLLKGPPTGISGYGLMAYGSAVDLAVAQLSYESGPLVTLTSSRVTEAKIRSIDLTAKEAYIEADLLGKTVEVHRRTFSEYINHNKRGIKYRQESILESIVVPVVEPLLSELQHFTDCVVEQKQPLVTPRDGLNALVLATQICDLICPKVIIPRQRAIDISADFQSLPISS